MRRFPLLALVAALVLASAGCSSNDFYRGRVESQGLASAQAFRVKDGAEQPVTARYTVQGQGVATVQTVKPYLTLDGSWQKDVSNPSAVPVAEEPGAVLVRPAPPGATPGVKTNVVTCDGQPAILVPIPSMRSTPAVAAPPPCAPAAPAAPLPQAGPVCTDGSCDLSMSAAPDCRPVYVGCDGTPGGHRPEPVGTLPYRVEPGTGWPCGAGATEFGNDVMGVLAVPPGLLVHAGECFYGFLRCLFTPPL